MSWNLIKEIFPNVVRYDVVYNATDYQTMAQPYYRNTVYTETLFKHGDIGVVELKITMVPNASSSPFAPKALLASLVPEPMLVNLKEFNSRHQDNDNFIDMKFIFPAATFDQTIMEMYKESYESRFTEQLEQELTKSK